MTRTARNFQEKDVTQRRTSPEKDVTLSNGLEIHYYERPGLSSAVQAVKD